jgi:hypothetical protein
VVAKEKAVQLPLPPLRMRLLLHEQIPDLFGI